MYGGEQLSLVSRLNFLSDFEPERVERPLKAKAFRGWKKKKYIIQLLLTKGNPYFWVDNEDLLDLFTPLQREVPIMSLAFQSSGGYRINIFFFLSFLAANGFCLSPDCHRGRRPHHFNPIFPLLFQFPFV